MEKHEGLRLVRERESAPVVAFDGLEISVMAPQGELTSGDLRAAAQFCFRQAQEGRPHVVLDLSGVDHLDYRGVGALHAAKQLLQRQGGDLKLCGATPYLVAILRAAGMHGKFDLCDTLVQARARFVREVQW